MRQQSRIASRLRANDPVMRRWLFGTQTDTRASACRHDPISHRLEGEGSLSARPARKTSLFGKPTFGGPTETKKARSVVALSRDPPLRAEFAGSPPAAGFSRAVDRPLVRIPADRHTTTGTCDLGKTVDTRFHSEDKNFFDSRQDIFDVRCNEGAAGRAKAGIAGVAACAKGAFSLEQLRAAACENAEIVGISGIPE
ncbi:hypothetical protein WOC76_06120 [Methylocystis sp. IM3]|uniref:hypothetical protein n=1 Tax=unclassified Methylocystis TaxID=2625913 RepID=UPI0030F8FBC3